MLIKTKLGNHTLHKSRPLLLTAREGYIRPATTGREWFATTTTTWRVDEIIRRRVRDWRRLTGETGHDGTRAETMRKDHDSIYTGTSSVFPAPLMEYIILRYGGPEGGRIFDAFAGGPVRALVSAIMGMRYVGVELRQEQIDENLAVLAALKLTEGVCYFEADARFISFAPDTELFGCAITCPPYWYLEKYSDRLDDLSNLKSYEEFNAGMFFSALAHYPLMKPGAFCCIIVAPFRNKKTGELIDFPGHTVMNWQEAGFAYWQSITLCKNFASAAVRSTNAWRGKKLVPATEFLLIFRKPGWENA